MSANDEMVQVTMPSEWPWPSPEDDGGAAHLVAGTRVPDIKLSATPGEPVSLAHVPGRSVVFVYPFTGRAGLSNPLDWDFIPGAHGSTPQAEGFRDHHAAYSKAKIQVFGLSTQGCAHHKELSDRLLLPFALLSDADFKFAGALRLPCFQTGGVTYLKRLTLVIESGRIESVVYPVHPPDRHAGDLLERIAAA